MPFYSPYSRRRYGRRYGGYARRNYTRPRSMYVRAAPSRRRRTTTAAPRRRRTSQAMCPCPGTLSAGQKFLLAQIDPFEPRCLGAKVPDSNTIPSVSVLTTQIVTPTFAVGGNDHCVAFIPSISGGIITATAGSPGWAWPVLGTATSLDKRADYINTYELDRPVAHGLRISSGLAPTSATGFVHVAVATESFNLATNWPYATSVSEMAGYPFYKRFSLAALTQSPITAINKYVDETAFRYTGADSTNVGNAGTMEFHVPRSWGALLVAVTGSPAGTNTQPISIELVLHTEAIPKFSAVLSGSTAAPLDNGILGATAHMVANSDFSHTEEQQDSYMNRALGAATEGLGQAGRVAFERIILPGIQSAAYGVAGHAMSFGISRGISGVNSNSNRLALG